MSLIITIAILSYYKRESSYFYKIYFSRRAIHKEIHTVNYFKKILKK